MSGCCHCRQGLSINGTPNVIFSLHVLAVHSDRIAAVDMTTTWSSYFLRIEIDSVQQPYSTLIIIENLLSTSTSNTSLVILTGTAVSWLMMSQF